MDTSFVFGGHSPISISISKTLAKHGSVQHISRSTDDSLRETFTTFPSVAAHSWGDFSNPLTDKQKEYLSTHKCKNLVFAHRYRATEPDDLVQFEVEVLFPMKVVQYLASSTLFVENSNVIFLTSPAANYVVTDQPLSYHLSKAAINQMTLYFSTVLGPKTKVNAIAPGSFVIKDRNRNFYESNRKITKSINQFLPLGKMPDVEDIAQIVEFLASDNNKVINGQILDLSGGYLGYEPSQIFLESLK